ncbi:hypothetical protein M422DRAFT_272838 [Sphaerobolus stellatus SS14]|uniref:Uncharacterized protein n=1 Tax=Sphaerobolus stellatus (strain SS14) TaxID=990650 RepID=A0A0C9ULJ6_SPHS4|nr:hypothetical protein M422DRAFT_272838 [Sphaerobolus stellatus SS14]
MSQPAKRGRGRPRKHFPGQTRISIPPEQHVDDGSTTEDDRIVSGLSGNNRTKVNPAMQIRDPPRLLQTTVSRRDQLKTGRSSFRSAGPLTELYQTTRDRLGSVHSIYFYLYAHGTVMISLNEATKHD